MDAQLVRFHSEFLAVEVLAVSMSRALQRLHPPLTAQLQAVVDQKLEEWRYIAMPGATPEQADLLAGEFREAFERLMERVLLKPGE
jgi:hypothetical protein